MKERIREIIRIGDQLFSKRLSLLSRWQDIAENFYPERADFTTSLFASDDFAGHLMTSVPSLARRDLGNAISHMLRPRGQAWFLPRTGDEGINKDPGALKWLDWSGEVMRRAMYDSSAHFVRATKEGDMDFASFGQCVISVDLNANRDGLLYRTWHLRDVAWTENAALEVDTVHRNWKLAARNLVRLFRDTVDPKVIKAAQDDPFKEIRCRHVIMPLDEYEPSTFNKQEKARRFRFVSLYIDCDNETVLEETPVNRVNYVIPRWQTVSGSQYAHSPATVIAIPDARMLQRMTLTLIEAGEKAVDPPMIGRGDALKGGVNSYAGGFTWIDLEYDESIGEALRPMPMDKTGLQFGVDREERITRLIQKAFFLDQLELPNAGAEKMTAYETQIRTEEYMRRALPLFEPLETEYNGALCNITFDIMMEQGAFGDPRKIPEPLLGQDIKFQFESPIQAAASRANAKAFTDSMQLLMLAAQVDPGSRHVLDIEEGLRDAMEGVGAPSEWLRSKDDIAALAQQDAQQQAVQQAASQVGAGAQVAEQVGKAGQALTGAGMLQPGDLSMAAMMPQGATP